MRPPPLREFERFTPDSDLRTCPFSDTLVRLYRRKPLRKWCLWCAYRYEGRKFHSATLRRILAEHHGVKVGAYSYGPCIEPGKFPPGVTVGRYVSIAAGVRVSRRNHPMDAMTTHPFFFNARCGVIKDDVEDFAPLWIGHDAWVGDNALILPRCSRIGIGAVVGAGAVVTKDVPDFAIVAGNPARLLRYRFDEDTQRAVLDSKWWELPVSALKPIAGRMSESLLTGQPLPTAGILRP